MTHLSAEKSPEKGANSKVDAIKDDEARVDSESLTKAETSQSNTTNAPKQTSLQELGFLKEKLLVCCNVIRKRLKNTEEKIDKKKGLRTDRITAGTILVEERSFLLRHPKNIS